MNEVNQFKMTEAHLKLINRMYVGWDDCEFGAPSINPKRPYGNSDVINDMAKILGFPISDNNELPESLIDYLKEIHKSMKIVLQIILWTQSFKIGVYEKTDEYDDHSWKLLEEV